MLSPAEIDYHVLFQRHSFALDGKIVGGGCPTRDSKLKINKKNDLMVWTTWEEKHFSKGFELIALSEHIKNTELWIRASDFLIS